MNIIIAIFDFILDLFNIENEKLSIELYKILIYHQRSMKYSYFISENGIQSLNSYFVRLSGESSERLTITGDNIFLLSNS